MSEQLSRRRFLTSSGVGVATAVLDEGIVLGSVEFTRITSIHR